MLNIIETISKIVTSIVATFLAILTYRNSKKK